MRRTGANALVFRKRSKTLKTQLHPNQRAASYADKLISKPQQVYQADNHCSKIRSKRPPLPQWENATSITPPPLFHPQRLNFQNSICLRSRRDANFPGSSTSHPIGSTRSSHHR
ncbi:hypothetical protein CEXT_290421 [Caerostris extrusa]|uniref:Uncharacterized protein n=1 Tax=Caerostris extrusa TaxID=172846 RepID=A0AAV4YG15_CAEEX|nr:hypothetical protein CEXT_290421 [Caerostris extrusa]